ncbi:MAG: UDP-N-acetylmuramate--L-alanine ligase [Microthrixaceae bacterium]
MAADQGRPRSELDLSVPRRIHVVAAGGAGMSAIARVLAGSGHHVSGSDSSDGARLRSLAAIGVQTMVGHSAGNLGDAGDLDALVVSSAVGEDNVEVEQARRSGVPVYDRRRFLPLLADRQPLLSVSGTHGKTTTSSMLAVALRGAGVEISWLIGADVPALGSPAAYHPGPYLVLEADESDGSFLASPRAGAVVTNLEADHLEYWGDWEALRSGFVEFVEGTDGPVVLCADDPATAELASCRARDRIITYGTSGAADVRLGALDEGADHSSFQLHSAGRTREVTLGMPGRHNALNATGALALVDALGHDLDRAAQALASHSGVYRRFETLGRSGGVSVVDDYAHLPSEVEAILAAARSRSKGRLVVVYQPHRYSRTQALAGSFAASFVDADVVVITELYPAGEKARPGVSGRLVLDAVSAQHRGPVIWAADLDAAASAVLDLAQPGDTVLTVGAGDVRTVGEIVLGALDASGERQ